MPPDVPFNDLRRYTAQISDRLQQAIARVIDRGWFLLGPETEAFETAFARYTGTSACVAVANGTDALEIALRSVGCTAGDEVIVAANAGMYATTAALAIGAVPVFADVDPTTLLVPPAAVAALVGPATTAVVATHLYGNVVDVVGLRAVLPSSVAILEDGAQAHGAALHDRPVGSLGDVAAFSFYPTKNLGAAGDAGAIVSNRADVIDQARALHQYGWEERYVATVAGGRNSRIDELQAAILLEVLPAVDERNRRRSAIREQYEAALGDRVTFVAPPPDTRSATHLCVIRSAERDRLLDEARDHGVACAVHYPVADHRQPVLQGRTFRHDGLAETERACAEVLSLPCFPELGEHEVEQVIEAVRKAS
jgi:dTDP-4-amino-4,6-dideoxygalactose transaminase